MRMKKRTKKILLTVIGIVAGVFILAVLFISPITKYVVEKYDEEYTGRQIRMDWAYVNPFTGYVYFRNLRMYESANGARENLADSVFFSSKGVGLDLAMLKLFSKTYEIRGLTLDHPRATIIQYDNKNTFNFKDLIEKFTPDEPKDSTKPPLHFNLLDLKINQGEVRYREKVIPIEYYIKEFDFESEGYRWDVDTMTGNFAFTAGMGSGKIKGDFSYNVKNQDYRLVSQISRLDMTIIQQYLRDLSNFGTVRALLDAKINASGNFKEATALDARNCRIELSDFHFGKNPKEDYASFEKLLIDIEHLNPQKKIRDLDTLMLTRPAFVYEKYDKLDNIQRMFGTSGSEVREAKEDPGHFNLILEIGEYVKEIVRNFFQSYFKINRFEISKADIKYADYSTSEKFIIALDPLSITSDSIDKRRNRASLALRSGINPYGYASLDLKVNTKDSSDFDLSYHAQKIPITLFNPYFITYTSFPMDRGTLEFSGNWRVRNAKIASENHLLIIDPRLSKRVKRKDAKWLPLPLAMALVRERGNVIDYSIPITGDLKDPHFKITDVLLDLLKNIFIKPPTIPYGVKVTEAERKIEKSLNFKWEIRDAGLRDEQKRFLHFIAEFLKDNKDARITVTPMEYAQKEKEHVLLFEAKRKYYLSANKRDPASFNSKDSTEVARMSRRDPGFIRYLDKQVKDQMLFTVQEKAGRIIPASRVREELRKLNQLRETNFMAFFKARGAEGQVKIQKPKEVIPYNGFSFFRIDYQGEIPESLRKAYEELEELDEEFPRKKYLRERKKLRDIFNASR
jgi:hypothetical protein